MFGTYDSVILTLMVLLAIVLSFFLAKWISKKCGAVNFVISTQVLWIVLAVISSLTFKGSSYAFTIPAIISLLLILPILVKVKWAKGVYHYVAVAGWTISSILLLAPIKYLIYIAKTISIAPIIVVITTLITFPIVGIVNWLTTNDGKA
ncbi:hypothetical protein [Lysinibacillus sp. NPDC047702]|uniref:hypothetical protein n=1 Tax=unclassified Lysinibacillus TaxID=2636778 RepID=UPI003CFEFDD1